MKLKSSKPAKKKVLGQLSWRVATSDVEAFVTETGGHLGPVTFNRRGQAFTPYSVAPWAEEKVDPSLPSILKVLRGDFFCLPFGGNAAAYQGEKHPVHGETANANWTLQSLTCDGPATTLHVRLQTTVRKGEVDKRIQLREGQNIVYSEHVLAGMNGPMNPGHHAMLRFPDEPGSGLISTSRFIYGQVFPGQFERPEARGYSLLKPGVDIESLDQVPTITGEAADLSRYPARRGFEDLVMMVSDDQLPFAWTAVVFPKQRAVWFALKNPRILRETIFWISNGGRHYPPWSGRHVNVMGLEDVTSYFADGLAESVRKNPLAEKGYSTCLQLNPKQPLRIPYMMGMAVVPAGFGHVQSIEASPNDAGIILRSVNGKQVRAAADLGFLK